MQFLYPVVECFDKDLSVIAYFYTEIEAHVLVNSLNKAGGMSSFGVGRHIIAYNNFHDYQQNNPKALREKVLAKLTEEERKILGVS